LNLRFLKVKKIFKSFLFYDLRSAKLVYYFLSVLQKFKTTDAIDSTCLCALLIVLLWLN